MTGSFIAFDGPNGVGKSSAMKTVAEALGSSGRDVVVTREPGGTKLAEELRGLLLDPSHPMDTTTQLLIFNAARRSHILDVIRPNVEAGRIVLCDRFISSSLVFQTLKPDGGPDLSVDEVLDAHRRYCFNEMPDLTVYLHAPHEVRAQRIAHRAGAPVDRFEEYDDAFDRAAADRFALCGALLRSPYAMIDASPAADEVAAACLRVVEGHLAGAKIARQEVRAVV
ncbi:dTMP kinase [Erythrobacter aureus]|uniref:Thymidylate kinase n=1 Tax=Erythrobacter aureus TaxID=2182384 RepID=A0A345YIJ3_9SPHN|nr:dTMP kinase [Erythrobacter aureus]AXK43745.1 dTMP kinase [Erythrobacter aureus]